MERLGITRSLAHCTLLTVLGGCFGAAPPLGPELDATTDGESSDDSATGPATASDPTSSGADDEPEDTSTDSTDSTGSTGLLESSDSGSEDGSTGEPAGCDVEMSFAEPTLLLELSTTFHEDHAWLSQDELTVYLSSNRDDDMVGYDIYTAVRGDLAEPFGVLTLLTGSANEDRRPTLTADGLTLFVGSSEIAAMSYDIMVATRANLLAEFSALAPLAVVNSDASDGSPWISPDGTTLYFESHRDGSNDIFRTQRRGNGPFEAPTPVGELNTASEDGAPVPSADGLVIYFSSNRVGGVGDYDVWTATRSSIDDGFGAATNVTEVSSDAIDWPTWVSPDDCRLYIGSRRDGGDYDLWVAQRGE